MISPYSWILRNLLESVNGAVAVGFADYDGETVQLEGDFEDYSHRLNLACQGIVLHNLQAFHRQFGETPICINIIYQDFRLLIHPLRSGYYLVLTLKRNSNLHQAARHLERVAEELNQDL